MLVKMQLSLPRDARYVSLMRKVADSVMRNFGVPDEAKGDMELAITEACANAVRHATDTSEYSVRIVVGPQGCDVEVVDCGPGFVGHPAEVAPGAESGRGVLLMRALVDELQFLREDDATSVRLVKRWPGVAAAHDAGPA